MAFRKSPRDFGLGMPKRMRRLACRNAILAKILSQDVLILEALSLEQPKTKQLRSILEAVGADRGCLLALDAPDENILKSGRNIPKTDIRPVDDLNAFEVLRRRKLVFTKPAFESLTARLAKEFAE